MKRVGLLAIFVLVANLFAAKVDTFYVKSRVMEKTIANIIIKPVQYKQEANGYPTLYLLHGAGGNFSDWAVKVPEIKEYADRYNIIIVCPDGGVTSWYWDSPIDNKMRYETYITRELVPWVDKNFKTIPSKEKRAITGLSMGGHGALYLAFRHQDIWGAAGSMSGGVDIRPFPNNWDMAKRLGSYANHKDRWEENTIINMLYLLNGKSLKIIFDCGVDDFFYKANKRLHQEMVYRNIPHEYIERPGKHDWNYWRNSIKYQ
ncbi:MAG TPA: esterase family protein, partial [Calditrichaeota bacterium]|nr:esterase family protein [Calditrichota bacterium]